MFQHILVPLDGSVLAEAVLPAAVRLVQLLGARVTLVHVLERRPPSQVHGERHLRSAEEAETYLRQVAQTLFPPGAQVTWHVHTEQVDNVVSSLEEHAGELSPDLILMVTHGSKNLAQWWGGSIAARLVSRTPLPLLLMRFGSVCPSPDCGFQRLLVPLDGHAEHEHGLRVAIGLAAAAGSALHLVTVVHNPSDLTGQRAATGRYLPGATRAWLEASQAAAAAYLDRLAQEAGAQGLRVTTEVRRGEPASAIVATATEQGADLVVLGTHGRAGMSAFWSGSVAPRVSERLDLPMLLVPATRTA